MPRTKGSGNLVSCSFEGAGDITGAPNTIVYLPEGEHFIHASVNGKPKKVKVKVDSSVLASFQAGLEHLASKNVRPITDFDHKRKGAASSLPKSFRYEEGRGLLLDVEWTSAGRTAIEGKDYSYFSPDFLLAADGTPTGIAKRGPVGTLVNDPAFEEIERIAASKASEEPEDTNKPNLDMSEQLFTIGLLTESEAAKDNAVTVAAKRVTALNEDAATVQAAAAASTVSGIQAILVSAAKAADVKPEDLGIQAAFAEGATSDELARPLGTLIVAAAAALKAAEESKVSAANASVEEMVKARKIPAKSEDLKAFWLKQFTEDPEGAAVAAAASVKIAPGLDAKIVSGAGAPATGDLEARTAAVIAAGRAKTPAEAQRVIFKEDPAAYESYRQSVGAE